MFIYFKVTLKQKPYLKICPFICGEESWATTQHRSWRFFSTLLLAKYWLYATVFAKVERCMVATSCKLFKCWGCFLFSLEF